ncbi:MAG: hypothetical protein HC903_19190 [Methylacidiphilales bacterium]|nr:hypothetical protein [Candidatus Methylacidiphilales bacterium]NJR14356.1 hypothetical protein [Calothrix sp. CSU_2_0]
MCEEITRSRSDSVGKACPKGLGVSLSPQLDKFKGKQNIVPWLKRVTGSNLTEHQLDKIFVKLETIWHLLFIEENQNLAKYHQQTENNQSEPSTTLLAKLEIEKFDTFAVFKYLNQDLQLEKALIMNILLKFTDDEDVQREEEQDIDDTLLWLIKEYIRLSSLPSLNEIETKRMFAILELAQIDNQLDEWISWIDTTLVENLEFTEQASVLNLEALDLKKLKKSERYSKYLDTILDLK